MTTTPNHTADQPAAMPDRELDAVAAEIVMGYMWKTCLGFDFPLLNRPDQVIDRDDWAFFNLLDDPHPGVPALTGGYEGFGLIVERMRHLGFVLDIKPMAGIDYEVGFARRPVNDGRNRWCSTHETLSRAAAIATVLAVEGAV